MSPTIAYIRTAQRNPATATTPATAIHFLQRSRKRGLYVSQCGWPVPPLHPIKQYRSPEGFRARTTLEDGITGANDYVHTYCLLCLNTPYGRYVTGYAQPKTRAARLRERITKGRRQSRAQVDGLGRLRADILQGR